MEPITEKDSVTFEKEKTPKGYAAVNVRKIK
jgi:cold shock CspA family protein